MTAFLPPSASATLPPESTACERVVQFVAHPEEVSPLTTDLYVITPRSTVVESTAPLWDLRACAALRNVHVRGTRYIGMDLICRMVPARKVFGNILFPETEHKIEVSFDDDMDSDVDFAFPANVRANVRRIVVVDGAKRRVPDAVKPVDGAIIHLKYNISKGYSSHPEVDLSAYVGAEVLEFSGKHYPERILLPESVTRVRVENEAFLPALRERVTGGSATIVFTSYSPDKHSYEPASSGGNPHAESVPIFLSDNEDKHLTDEDAMIAVLTEKNGLHVLNSDDYCDGYTLLPSPEKLDFTDYKQARSFTTQRLFVDEARSRAIRGALRFPEHSFRIIQDHALLKNLFEIVWDVSSESPAREMYVTLGLAEHWGDNSKRPLGGANELVLKVPGAVRFLERASAPEVMSPWLGFDNTDVTNLTLILRPFPFRMRSDHSRVGYGVSEAPVMEIPERITSLRIDNYINAGHLKKVNAPGAVEVELNAFYTLMKDIPPKPVLVPLFQLNAPRMRVLTFGFTACETDGPYGNGPYGHLSSIYWIYDPIMREDHVAEILESVSGNAELRVLHLRALFSPEKCDKVLVTALNKVRSRLPSLRLVTYYNGTKDGELRVSTSDGLTLIGYPPYQTPHYESLHAAFGA